MDRTPYVAADCLCLKMVYHSGKGGEEYMGEKKAYP